MGCDPGYNSGYIGALLMAIGPNPKLPFLVLRSDAGKYAHLRNLAPRTAKHVKGDIRRSWTGSALPLDGKTVVKVSLQTGDSAAVSNRRSEIHSQVAGLIRAAMVLVEPEANPGSSPFGPLPRVSPWTSHVPANRRTTPSTRRSTVGSARSA